MLSIAVIIPAFNEMRAVGAVLDNIPKHVREVIVVNNNSSDATAERAKVHGATVLDEKQQGYGHACLKGINYLKNAPPDIVVFLDCDFSDYPEDLDTLVAPIINNQADFVLGARVKSLREKGAMTPQQIFGNALACSLMRWLYGAKYTDLGPFRAIRWNSLSRLKMKDTTYGWTVEMQLKILRQKIPYIEIPVRYRKRIGHSKVSGTLKGTIFAGIKILGWIGKHYFRYE
ncbi:glycosyltransferase family 2 protein [Flavobacteriaceae bacterium]|nr:glycosyltransferase family 2 protein [Flavobacteriaceae bacterium]